jgi:putative peptidoglycan lipid II flippase
MVAWALALFTVGLPAHAVVEIIVRAFYAMHDTRTPVLVGVAAMALNVALSLAFIALFQAAGWLPHGGLALSNTLATTLEMAVLLILLRRRLVGLEGHQTLHSLGRFALAAAGMAALVVALRWLLAGASAWLLGGLGAVTGAGAYLALSLLLGAPEPRAMWGMVRARRRP